MDARGARLAVVAGVVAVAAVLFLVLRGGGDGSSKNAGDGTGADRAAATGPTATATAPPGSATITVRDGKPVGGVQDLSYRNGDRIRIEVRSDVADEVHVHGYDLIREVPAGGSVKFDFPATIEGGFEIELEGRKEQLAELKVEP